LREREREKGERERVRRRMTKTWRRWEREKKKGVERLKTKGQMKRHTNA
jgi:hypothetical protein